MNKKYQVDFSKIKRLKNVLNRSQLQSYWLNDLTFDEAMILMYWQNPSEVIEPSVQADALDRHKKCLPLWRIIYHPEVLDPAFDPFKGLSPGALKVLERLDVDRKQRP
jgi:hypothetical protein